MGYKLDNAAKMIESVLAQTIPMILDFLARLLNMGGISKKIQEIMERIRKPINKGIDKVLELVIKLAKKVVDKAKGKDLDSKNDKKEKGVVVTDVDRKRHREIGEEIERELKKPIKKAKNFDEFYQKKTKLARKLEKRYQRRLKKGIKIKISFKNLENEKKDNDIDFKVRIAPNAFDKSFASDYVQQGGHLANVPFKMYKEKRHTLYVKDGKLFMESIPELLSKKLDSTIILVNQNRGKYSKALHSNLLKKLNNIKGLVHTLEKNKQVLEEAEYRIKLQRIASLIKAFGAQHRLPDLKISPNVLEETGGKIAELAGGWSNVKPLEGFKIGESDIHVIGKHGPAVGRKGLKARLRATKKLFEEKQEETLKHHKKDIIVNRAKIQGYETKIHKLNTERKSKIKSLKEKQSKENLTRSELTVIQALQKRFNSVKKDLSDTRRGLANLKKKIRESERVIAETKAIDPENRAQVEKFLSGRVKKMGDMPFVTSRFKDETIMKQLIMKALKGNKSHIDQKFSKIDDRGKNIGYKKGETQLNLNAQYIGKHKKKYFESYRLDDNMKVVGVKSINIRWVCITLTSWKQGLLPKYPHLYVIKTAFPSTDKIT